MAKKKQKKVKGFEDYFSQSIQEFGDKFVSFLKVFLVLYFLPLIILGMIGMLAFASYIVTYSQEELIENGQVLLSNIFSPGLIVLAFLLLLTFMVFYVLMSISFIEIAFAKKPLGLKESVRKSKKHFWRFLGLGIVLTFALIILYALFIIPGIIFNVFWIFSVYILVDKKAGVFDSIKQSYRMVKGRWWTLFGHSVLLIIIAMIVSWILMLVPFFGRLISSLVVTPIIVIFYKNWYLDLKAKK